MNTNKREEKKCGEACLSHYGPVALYQYENSDKTFWLCNAALFEELRRGEKVIPSLPQNGDREKEWKCPCSCHDGSGVHFREECPCNQPDSPSEGKEKEPKECEHLCGRCGTFLPSALAEKETALKTDWEERFESIKIQCADDSENHNREIKAFIQTLLKEKDEEFVKEIEKVVDEWNSLEEMDEENAVSLVVTKLIAKYSPEGREE